MSNKIEEKKGLTSYDSIDLDGLTRAWADPANKENIKQAFKKAGLGSDARQYLDHALHLVQMAATLINSSVENTKALDETRRIIQSNPRLANANAKLDGFLKDIADPGLERFELDSNRHFLGTLKRCDVTGKFRNVESIAMLIGDKNSDSPRAYVMKMTPGTPNPDTMAKLDLSPIISMVFPK